MHGQRAWVAKPDVLCRLRKRTIRREFFILPQGILFWKLASYRVWRGITSKHLLNCKCISCNAQLAAVQWRLISRWFAVLHRRHKRHPASQLKTADRSTCCAASLYVNKALLTNIGIVKPYCIIIIYWQTLGSNLTKFPLVFPSSKWEVNFVAFSKFFLWFCCCSTNDQKLKMSVPMALCSRRKLWLFYAYD